MNDLTTFVMAGGCGRRLLPLTERRAKPAVAFGGSHRVIDFSLSNCLHSGVRLAGVLVQYAQDSLIQHISTNWGSCPGAGLEVTCLPPTAGCRGSLYRGTADAVFQNLEHLEMTSGGDVLVLAADQVYLMDYRPFVAWHRRSGADLTIASVRRPRHLASGLGILQRGRDGCVREFIEKPSPNDPRLGGDFDVSASLGIYVFREEILRQILAEGPGRDRWFDFGADIIPCLVPEAHVQSYLFEQDPLGGDAYWEDVGTVDRYYDAHMHWLAGLQNLISRNSYWAVRPTLESSSSGPTQLRGSARIEASRVGSSCLVEGRVRHSVVFPGATIERDAELCESVVLPGARVGRRCRLNRAIIDEGVWLHDDESIGFGRDPRDIRVSTAGVGVLSRAPRGMQPLAELLVRCSTPVALEDMTTS